MHAVITSPRSVTSSRQDRSNRPKLLSFDAVIKKEKGHPWYDTVVEKSIDVQTKKWIVILTFARMNKELGCETGKAVLRVTFFYAKY